jgi:hypothetical protein
MEILRIPGMETVKFKIGELEVEIPENTFKEYIDL